jgi:hypothetical protein
MSPSREGLAALSASLSKTNLADSVAVAAAAAAASADGSSVAASSSTAALDGSGEEPSKDVLSDLLETPMDADNEDVQAKVLAKLEGKKDSDVEAFYRNARAKAMRFRPTLLPAPAAPVDFQGYFLPELARPTSPIPRSATPAPAMQPTSLSANDAPYVHVGRPVLQKEMTQSVKATLWMSTSFPLFIEQLFPVLTIMSPTNEHFARFKEFVDLKLPRGFPVKVGPCLHTAAAPRLTGADAWTVCRDSSVWGAHGQDHLPGVPHGHDHGRGPVCGRPVLH